MGLLDMRKCNILRGGVLDIRKCHIFKGKEGALLNMRQWTHPEGGEAVLDMRKMLYLPRAGGASLSMGKMSHPEGGFSGHEKDVISWGVCVGYGTDVIASRGGGDDGYGTHVISSRVRGFCWI